MTERLDEINARLAAIQWCKDLMSAEEWRLIAERNAIMKQEERRRQRELKQARRFLGESVQEVA